MIKFEEVPTNLADTIMACQYSWRLAGYVYIRRGTCQSIYWHLKVALTGGHQ